MDPVAMPESNPILHQSREDAATGATPAPPARPLSPCPRSPLPKRDPRRGRHWIRGADDEVTVGELLHRNRAEYHNTDVQDRLDAAERAS